jgi:DNA-binding SARP family transcriptional activator
LHDVPHPWWTLQRDSPWRNGGTRRRPQADALRNSRTFENGVRTLEDRQARAGLECRETVRAPRRAPNGEPIMPRSHLALVQRCDPHRQGALQPVDAALIPRSAPAAGADLRNARAPIEVRTLGRFEIVKDGQALRFEGKMQRKPFALLKALVAMGGQFVAEDKLIDILWAGALQGDEQKAFDVTLHRLRKLLGHERAISVSNRCVSLNPAVIWIDLWALERELALVNPVAPASIPDAAQLESAAPVVLDLYRGQFLDGEPDSGWLLPVRNRLNWRFERFVMRVGDHWESAGQWARAAELFQHAIELNPLAEGFYRRWMVCLREQGSRAEAIDVFRRCRQVLSVTLGVKPVADTDAVYHRLLDA